MTAPIPLERAAAVLGVEPQLLERFVARGLLAVSGRSNVRAVDGAQLVGIIDAIAAERPVIADVDSSASSARNRLEGLVTRVVRDTVMAQVELQAGAFRFVSLVTRESADELELEPGVIAIVSVKATNVVIERGRVAGRP